MKRNIILLCLLALATAIFFALNFDAYLEFETLKQRRADLLGFYKSDPLLLIAGFMFVHITALTLSLPGAVLTMGLAGGALFGPAWGTLITLSSLTVGDSLAFLLARHVLRHPVEKRFGAYLLPLQKGVERDGAFFLLGMRLMAVIPYFVVNLAMALTRMPLRIFAPVSFVGLAPATALYVTAGTALSRIREPSDIYSSALILSFVLLGLLPIGARLAFKRIDARQILKAEATVPSRSRRTPLP